MLKSRLLLTPKKKASILLSLESLQVHRRKYARPVTSGRKCDVTENVTLDMLFNRKFSAFYRIRRFITVFTKLRQLALY